MNYHVIVFWFGVYFLFHISVKFLVWWVEFVGRVKSLEWQKEKIWQAIRELQKNKGTK